MSSKYFLISSKRAVFWGMSTAWKVTPFCDHYGMNVPDGDYSEMYFETEESAREYIDKHYEGHEKENSLVAGTSTFHLKNDKFVELQIIDIR